MTMTRELVQALRDLSQAHSKLICGTNPITPMPKGRKFKISAGVWLCIGQYMSTCDDSGVNQMPWYSAGAAIATTFALARSERERKRIIQRVRKAVEWCQKTALVRRQKAEEMYLRYKPYYDMLEAEVAMLTLCCGEPPSATTEVLLLSNALAGLEISADRLYRATGLPPCELGIRQVTLAPGIVWPHPSDPQCVVFTQTGCAMFLHDWHLPREIVRLYRYHPKKIWRALLRIRRATAKCTAIYEAMGKAKEEIKWKDG